MSIMTPITMHQGNSDWIKLIWTNDLSSDYLGTSFRLLRLNVDDGTYKLLLVIVADIDTDNTEELSFKTLNTCIVVANNDPLGLSSGAGAQIVQSASGASRNMIVSSKTIAFETSDGGPDTCIPLCIYGIL